MSTPHLIGLIFVAVFVLWGFGAFCGAMWHSSYSTSYHDNRRATIALESAEMRRMRMARQVQPEPATVVHVHLHQQSDTGTTWRPGWRDMRVIEAPVVNGELG